jgi:hypothetical protein
MGGIIIRLVDYIAKEYRITGQDKFQITDQCIIGDLNLC